MIKLKKKLFIKLFKFKLFFNNNQKILNQINFFNFIKFLKIFLKLKNYGIFIPTFFFTSTTWIFSFWKKGFISNFKIFKWYFINFFFLKKLPSFMINLTNNNDISLEILKKNIPLFNIFKLISKKKTKIKNKGDYFLSNTGFLLNLDSLFFFLKLFDYMKKYKNV